MTTEELMKPRYKCIADYPQAPYNEGDEHKFIEGDLLIQCNVNGAITFKRHGRLGFMSVGVPCCAHPEKYPKVFRPLLWWEERTIEELPAYVKLNPGNTFGTDEVFKVIEIKEYVDGIGLKIKPDVNPIELKCLLPSNETEYESYINQNNNNVS